MRSGENDNVEIRRREKGFADDFYTSWVWRRCAEDYKKKVGGLCERCRRKGEIAIAEQVHHKIRLTPENINKPEITLNWANLEALCLDCHKKEHRKKKRWTVDEDGNVTAQDPP